MTARQRTAVSVAMIVGILAGIGPSAHAFVPMGEFDPYQRLWPAIWYWPAMNDANNDGDISGPNEGVEYLVEGGPYGFTDDEIDIIRESFDVWQDVPTAHIGFQQTGVNLDPLLIGEGAIDLVNYVAIDVVDDPFALGIPPGALGVTFLTTVETDTSGLWIPPGDLDIPGLYITPYQILEADILIDGTTHRAAVQGQAPEYDLKGTLVHEMGHFLGLMHTPLNNLVIAPGPTLLEGAAFSQRDATGVLQRVGATPTMFPIVFSYNDGMGNIVDGGITLAPDDIAGISYLYPRGSQANFFTITQEVWSQTRAGIPPIPIVAAHVVAWCDTDNDANTPRIPLISTLSGLYETQPAWGGRFNLNGLLKTIESVGEPNPFQATYTLTANPLNDISYERQAPATGYDPDHYFSESILGRILTPTVPVWPSEVFHEKGNIIDVANHDIGTPLTYDSTRRFVVSVDSGKTLATMLPLRTPMFGDRNNVCPLNLTFAFAGSVGGDTPNTLRRLRDNTLLSSALGTAVVDAYYRLGPAMAELLLRHPAVFRGVRSSLAIVDWTVANARFVATLLVLGGLGMLLYRRKRAAGVAAFLLIGALALAPAAEARLMLLDDVQIVAMSDEIVTGTVTAVEARFAKSGGQTRIVTDVTVRLDDVVKGRQNKSAVISLIVPGGQVGTVRTRALDLPEFATGEEVLLYLAYREGYGYVVVAGNRGKINISSDEKGAKFVTALSPEADAALDETRKTLQQEAAAQGTSGDMDGQIALDTYKRYLRELVAAEEN